MKVINSKQNQYIKDLSKLNSKKEIIEKGLFLVEGKNLIIEAINSGIVENLLLLNEEDYSEFQINKTIVTKEIIEKLSYNKTNNGSIAVCKYEKTSVNFNLVKKIIVLENVNNPGNLGAIIRTALAFNFDAVITVGNSVFVYNDKVVRSAQGALFKMPIMQISDFNLIKSFLPYKFVLDNNSISFDELEINKNEKFALVFGNEANGISEKLLNEWHGVNVKINMNSKVESLNLAVASGIAMNKFK